MYYNIHVLNINRILFTNIKQTVKRFIVIEKIITENLNNTLNGYNRTSSYTLLSSSNNRMLWQQKHGSYCAIQGLHSGQQGPKVCMLYSNTGYIQPSQQRAARAWAKSHRTAGPAVRPAEAQGLRDPLVGPPGLWQGAALLLPREDSLHSASRPCSCGPRDSWLQTAGSHKAQGWENTSFRLPRGPGSGWGRRGKEAAECGGVSSEDGTTRARKTESETTGATLERRVPQNTSAEKEGEEGLLVSQASATLPTPSLTVR